MNNSNLFKLAHSLTKATVQAGDNYQVTFGASIKFINSVHSINGTDKQIAWANTIIANIITAINNAQVDTTTHFLNRRSDVRALPLLNQTLNKGLVFFINKFASMSLQELFAMTSGNSYKDMRLNVFTKITKAVMIQVKKIEVKRNTKLIK